MGNISHNCKYWFKILHLFPIKAPKKLKKNFIDYRIKMDQRFDLIAIAIKAAPPCPKYIPDNICTSNCNVCDRRWFENTIIMFHCQCKELRVCPECADKMKEPVKKEHNLVDCNYGSDSEDSQAL